MEQGHYVQLKPNVWKWQIGSHAYSLKKYEKKEDANKIRFIHEQLTKVGANIIVPIEPYPDEYMIQQPWIDSGKKVQFHQFEDREKSLSLLHQLHDTGTHINWREVSDLHEINLMRKWKHRLEKWEYHEGFLHRTLGSKMTEEITELAKKSLSQLLPMSNENLTLLHGDVVHHNFVRDRNDHFYLIDFDLACLGPAEVELILWTHRVLPHYQYDYKKLILEHPSIHHIDRSYLLFPNEMMREWLYAATLTDIQLRVFLPKLKRFTDKALKRMPQLWDDCSNLKK